MNVQVIKTQSGVNVNFPTYTLVVTSTETKEFFESVLESLTNDDQRATWLTTNYDCEQI